MLDPAVEDLVAGVAEQASGRHRRGAAPDQASPLAYSTYRHSNPRDPLLRLSKGCNAVCFDRASHDGANRRANSRPLPARRAWREH